MTNYAELADKLKPYILPWLSGGGGVAAATGGMIKHALSGPYHDGPLAQSQAPWAATVTQLNSHMGNANAHHMQDHVLATNVALGDDHTVSGLTAGQVLRASAAGAANFQKLDYADLVYAGGGAALDVFGLSAANTPARLTPSSNPGATGAILRSTVLGGLTLVNVVGTTAVTTPLVQNLSGSLELFPSGAAVLPNGSILKDLGDYNRKWRTLYAAELYVETLVAQDVLSTIGGRIMVAPTTTLIADVSAGATTIDVKHNNITDAYVYLAAAPGGAAQIEVMKVTAGPTGIAGGYRYTVTRAVDGSPANAWVAGDAVANVGSAAGQGWLDLTSTNTVRGHLGPSLTVYVRTGTAAWTDVKPVVSVGNLRSFVDYGADEFGFGLGNDLALTPTTGFKGMTGDRTNGLRLFNTDISLYSGGVLKAKIQNDGQFFFGATSGARIQWDNTDLKGVNSGGTTQWYARASTGLLYWGAGAGYLDSVGAHINGAATETTGIGEPGYNGDTWPSYTSGIAGQNMLLFHHPTHTGDYFRAYYDSYDYLNPDPPEPGDPYTDFHYRTAMFEAMEGSTGKDDPYALWSRIVHKIGSFNSELTNGYFNGGYGRWRAVIAGTERLRADHAGATVTGTLSVVGAGTITGTLTTNSTASFGSGLGTGTALLRLGYSRTDDGPAAIYLTADNDTYTDYGLRMVRSAGANGTGYIMHRGTGEFAITAIEAADIAVRTNNIKRLSVLGTGLVGIGNITPTSLVHADGNVRAKGFYADADNGGVAGTVGLSGGSNTAANGTGVGTIYMKGNTNRSSTAFIKVYIGTAIYWVPAFTDITG